MSLMLFNRTKKAIPLESEIHEDFDTQSVQQALDPTRKWVLLASISNLGIGALLLILTVFNGSLILAQGSKSTQAFIQVASGERLLAKETSLSARTDESIKKYVSDSMAGLLTWDVFALSDNQIDRGLSIRTEKGEKLLTTSAYEASYALSDSFRSEFQKILADLIPQNVFLGDVKSVYSVKFISEPVLLKSGVWEIGVVGNIILFNTKNNTQKAIPFNRSVQVRSIQPPLAIPSELRNEYHELVIESSLTGLEIIDIRDLDLSASSEVKEGI